MHSDGGKSVSDYAAIAADYDRRTRLVNALRLAAVQALELQPGDIVLDAACGSGFCFAPILARIGPAGRLLAFDSSPDLLEQARARAAGHGNVSIVQARAEQAGFAGTRPRALLFSYTHDVLQSEAALDNLLGQASPGARVALCGSVLWPAAWPLSLPVNAWLRARHRRYITNMEDFDRPWRRIEPRLCDFSVARRGPGWRYLARGRLA